MTVRRLKSDRKTFPKAEYDLYAGQTVQTSDERDYSGRVLCRMLTGPLAGLHRWIAEKEMDDERDRQGHNESTGVDDLRDDG